MADTAGSPARGPRLLEVLRNLVARGYSASSPPEIPVDVVLPTGQRAAPSPEDFPLPGPCGIVLILPTCVGRADAAEHGAGVEQIVQQVQHVAEAHQDAQGDSVVVVGLQWDTRSEREEALRRASAWTAQARPGVSLVCLVMPRAGKRATLNAALRAVAGRADVVGWVDDDVVLEPGTVAALAADLAAGPRPSAVGAVKRPHCSGERASKFLAWAKQLSPSSTVFPHGCCLLVHTEVVGDGLPSRYHSDDVLVCYRLLRPDLRNPLERLRLVPGAVCHYTVGGPAGPTVRRLRRMLTNQTVHLADAPYPVACFYFRRVMFPGLWPLNPPGGSDRRRPLRATVQAQLLLWSYFLLFSMVALDLAVRGAVGRPRGPVPWGGYGSALTPDVGRSPAVPAVRTSPEEKTR